MSLTRPTVNANGNLFEVSTVQAGAVRTMVEALKEILTEANLELPSQARARREHDLSFQADQDDGQQ